MPSLTDRLRRSVAFIAVVWGRLRSLFGDRITPAVLLVCASIGAGLAEAGVLTLVANVAAAMVVHAHHARATLGPLAVRPGIGLALALALALGGVRLLLQLAIAWLPARISSEVQAGLRRDLFDAFTVASRSVQSEERDGYLQELMTDQAGEATRALLNVVVALSGLAMFVALVGAALLVNALVAVIILASAIILFWGLRPIARLGHRTARLLSQVNVDHAAETGGALRLAEETRVFGAAASQRLRVGRLIDGARDVYFRYMLAGGLIQSTYQSTVILLIVGGLAGLYVAGAGNVAALGAVVLMLVRASSYAQQFQGGYQSLSQLLPYLDRLQGTAARYRASAPVRGKRSLPRVETVAFDDVTFSYGRRRPVLQGISFAVDAGEAIGVVGPSGAGKSTLVQLLLRLRDADDGVYLINGEPANAFDCTEWQRRVAYVAQEPRIMHATVAENIRFFRNFDDLAVERAARRAHLHDDIMLLPYGYDTVVGQVADAISGGQRQRLCLARAIVAEPDVMVLDEPTSALDMASEAAVQASLAELRGKITLFIVAHRMSTLTICDRVLVLAQGEVEAFGPASELAASNAFYQNSRALARG